MYITSYDCEFHVSDLQVNNDQHVDTKLSEDPLRKIQSYISIMIYSKIQILSYCLEFLYNEYSFIKLF